MARPVVVIKTLTAADADAVAQTQAPAARGNFNLNGVAVVYGIAVLDTQRRILITSGGDDSDIDFTVYGTNGADVAIQETVAGTNAGTVATDLDFATVTRVVASGAVAAPGAQIGTNTTGSTAWQIPNQHITPFEIGVQLVLVSGAATFSIEYTDEPVLAPMPVYRVGPLPPPVPIVWPTLNGFVASGAGAINVPIAAWRLTITAGTGAVEATAIQAGIRN